jgi:protein XRP2
MFRDKKGEVLVKKPGDINGLEFMIKDLEDCTVVLLDNIAQLTVDRCKNTRLFIGPVKGSIFVRNCSDCHVIVSCGQFRCRELTDSSVYLYTPNDPIIESSSNLTFAPYNFKYPLLKQHAEAADLIGEFKAEDGSMQKRTN